MLSLSSVAPCIFLFLVFFFSFMVWLFSCRFFVYNTYNESHRKWPHNSSTTISFNDMANGQFPGQLFWNRTLIIRPLNHWITHFEGMWWLHLFKHITLNWYCCACVYIFYSKPSHRKYIYCVIFSHFCQINCAFIFRLAFFSHIWHLIKQKSS